MVELENHCLTTVIVTITSGKNDQWMLTLVGEILIRNNNYRISKYLPVRNVLIKKGTIIISQWRNLTDTTLIE